MLGMVAISAYWNKLMKKPMETLASYEITLLEWLHRKSLVGSFLVTHEATILNSPSQSESSIDFISNPSGMDMIVLMARSLTNKIVKVEHNSRKPPFSSAMVLLKGSSSKRKVVAEKLFLWKE